jgi:hypothetical protein
MKKIILKFLIIGIEENSFSHLHKSFLLYVQGSLYSDKFVFFPLFYYMLTGAQKPFFSFFRFRSDTTRNFISFVLNEIRKRYF